MSYQIYLDRLEDIYRLVSSPQVKNQYNQNVLLQIDDRKTNILRSPPISTQNPVWTQSYGFVPSQNDRIYFRVLSLHAYSYQKKLAEGLLDLYKYRDSSFGSQRVSKQLINNTEVYLFSDYNQQCILELSIRFTEHKTDPRQKLVPVSDHNSFSQTSAWKSQYQKGSKMKSSSSHFSSSISSKYNNQKYDQNAKKNNVFFKGNCETKNAFSFMDQKRKGQHFHFVERPLPKT